MPNVTQISRALCARRNSDPSTKPALQSIKARGFPRSCIRAVFRTLRACGPAQGVSPKQALGNESIAVGPVCLRAHAVSCFFLTPNTVLWARGPRAKWQSNKFWAWINSVPLFNPANASTPKRQAGQILDLVTGIPSIYENLWDEQGAESCKLDLSRRPKIGNPRRWLAAGQN